MAVIIFSYRDAKGDVSQRELVQWSENSNYIQGRSSGDTFPKTFRKDRIIAFLQGADLLLNEKAPPAPRSSPSAFAAAAASSSGLTPRAAPDGKNQILFTGFGASERAELEQKAESSGLKVMKTPGKTLTFLCYGSNAGPVKVTKAQEAGAFIIDSEQFLHLIQTGELP